MNLEQTNELKRIVAYTPPRGLIIKTCLSGSYAYGYHTEASDLDVRGIYVLPNDSFLGFTEPKLELEPEEFTDCKWFELKKFLMLAMKGNPHQLEILFSEPLVEHALFKYIKGHTSNILGKKGIYDAYRGFAKQECYSILKNPDSDKAGKRWSHCFRLFWQARTLLLTGQMEVKLGANGIEFIKEVRAGKYDNEHLATMFDHQITKLEEAYAESKLPEEADWAAVEGLMKFVRSHVY